MEAMNCSYNNVMAHLMSIPLATHCILPSYSSYGLERRIRLSPMLPCLKVIPEMSRCEIACVSNIRASTPDQCMPEFCLTAPTLQSVVGSNTLERVEIMSIASADAADQAPSLPGAESTGTKFSSVESLRRREVTISAKEKESAAAEAGRTSSIWDKLIRAFEKPSFQTSAVIEESGSTGAPLAGADPVQFLFVSMVLIFIWWLGNYYVPDLVFKNTVFRDQSKDSPLSGEAGEAGAEQPTIVGFAQTPDSSRKKSRKIKRK